MKERQLLRSIASLFYWEEICMQERNNELEINQEYSELVILKKYILSLLTYYQKKEENEHKKGAIEALSSVSLEVDRLIKEEEEEADD